MILAGSHEEIIGKIEVLIQVIRQEVVQHATRGNAIVGLVVEMERHIGLTVELQFYFKRESLRCIKAIFPSHLSEGNEAAEWLIKRLQICLAIWMPMLLRVSDELTASFSVRFSADDNGEHNVLSMDSCDANNLIPDIYSFDASRRLRSSAGAMHAIRLPYAEFREQWLKRKPLLFWRGSTTGGTIGSSELVNPSGIALKNQRIAMCLRFKGFSSIDLKISSIVQCDLSIRDELKRWLLESEILSEHVAEHEFAKYRYFPDIAGNARGWGTVNRYLNGNLVFKPEGDRHLYYDRFMEPWVHFVPVGRDFADLVEKVAWADINPGEAALIAWRGQQRILEFLKTIASSFESTVRDRLVLLPTD